MALIIIITILMYWTISSIHQFSHPTSHQKKLWCSQPESDEKQNTFFKASANAFTGHEYPLNLDSKSRCSNRELEVTSKIPITQFYSSIGCHQAKPELLYIYGATNLYKPILHFSQKSLVWTILNQAAELKHFRKIIFLILKKFFNFLNKIGSFLGFFDEFLKKIENFS